MFMCFCRLQKVLGLDSLDEVLDTKLVNSKHIVQNVYNVNKQGIVTLEDKSSEYFRNVLFFLNIAIYFVKTLVFIMLLFSSGILIVGVNVYSIFTLLYRFWL